MGLISEFKEFALKGNVLDLAVGVIIGGAFGGIVNSLIKDVIMPVVSIPGNVDFSNLYVALTPKTADAISKATQTVGDKVVAPTLEQARALGPVMAYGNFITVLINFLILAFCIFLVVKAFNTARKRFEAQKPAPAPAGPTAEQKLLTEIRDLLAKR
jgi:large conductance mechanosensitive channel